jgi:hypothetical protein
MSRPAAGGTSVHAPKGQLRPRCRSGVKRPRGARWRRPVWLTIGWSRARRVAYVCIAAILHAVASALVSATRRAGLPDALSSSARPPAVALTCTPAPAVSVSLREERLLATVPCGTASALIIGGKEHSCQPVSGVLIEDELIAQAMWPGVNLASRSTSEEVVDPGRDRHLIGTWLPGSR